MEPTELSPEAAAELAAAEVIQRAETLKRQRIDLARRDVNTFIEYVMKDEETGLPVIQAPTHVGWHQLADQHDRLVIWSHTEAGKTTQMAIGRTLWELGRDPTLRFLILSDVSDQAVKILGTIRKYIELSAELHEVFPNLTPGSMWTDVAIKVNSGLIQKDPNVQCIGMTGNVTGARLDRVIVDDILNYENTRTPENREDTIARYKAMVPGRMTARCRVIVIGTAFHKEDALHHFATASNFHAVRYPVIDDEGRPRWPEKWPLDRIDKRKVELGLFEANRQLFCIVTDDKEARFKEEWIKLCLKAGNGRQLIPEIKTMPLGGRTYTGVDLGVQRHSKSDRTSLFTIFVHANGKREPIDIDAGRFAGPEIVTKIRDKHRRYGSICVVENNAAQDFIVQFALDGAALPILPFTTGKNKAHPEFGIESIAVEMSQGLWIIPNNNESCHPEVQAWINEMIQYTPLAHTGDRLMSSWFAREGMRLGIKPRVETGNLRLTAR